ncbi:MAG: hypothetical protein ABEJ24_01300 [Candidatus Magasanikbacteria bacterium]
MTYNPTKNREASEPNHNQTNLERFKEIAEENRHEAHEKAPILGEDYLQALNEGFESQADRERLEQHIVVKLGKWFKKRAEEMEKDNEVPLYFSRLLESDHLKRFLEESEDYEKGVDADAASELFSHCVDLFSGCGYDDSMDGIPNDLLEALLRANKQYKTELKKYFDVGVDQEAKDDFRNFFISQITKLSDKINLAEPVLQKIRERLEDIIFDLVGGLSGRNARGASFRYYPEEDRVKLTLDQFKGEHDPQEQCDLIKKIAVHETLHAVSCFSANKEKTDIESLGSCKLGLLFESDWPSGGHNLNEGVTDYLAIQFLGHESKSIRYSPGDYKVGIYQPQIAAVEAILDDIPEEILFGAYFESYQKSQENTAVKTKELLSLMEEKYGDKDFFFVLDESLRYLDPQHFNQKKQAKKLIAALKKEIQRNQGVSDILDSHKLNKDMIAKVLEKHVSSQGEGSVKSWFYSAENID